MIKKVFYLRFEDSEKGVKRKFNRNRTLHLLENVDEPEVLRDNNTRIFYKKIRTIYGAKKAVMNPAIPIDKLLIAP
jgi:hypothetical protein